MKNSQNKGILLIAFMIIAAWMLNGCMGSYYTATNDWESAQVYMEDGRLYYQDGDFAQAEQAFTQAYKLLKRARSGCQTGPDCKLINSGFKDSITYVLSMRALSRLQLNDLRGAESDASLALEYEPTNPLPMYAMAKVHIALGEYAQARQLRDQLYRITRNSAYTESVRRLAADLASFLDIDLGSR